MRKSAGPPVALLLVVVAAACAGPGPSASPGGTDAAASLLSTPEPTPEPDGVGADLEMLVSTLDRVHPNAWHGIAREDFVAALDAYGAALPGYTPRRRWSSSCASPPS